MPKLHLAVGAGKRWDAPDLRNKARDEFLRAVDEMIPKGEKQIFSDGAPQGSWHGA